MKNFPKLFSLLLVFLTLVAPTALVAQTTGTISGVIKDDETKEALPNVNVILQGTPHGAAADLNGHYTLSNIPPGTYTIVVSVVGYKKTERNVTVTAGRKAMVDFNLKPEVIQVGEVMVYGASLRRERITEAPASVTVLDSKDIARHAGSGQLPKLLEMQPGVDLVQNGLFDFNLNTRGFTRSLNRRVLVLLDGRDLATAFLSSQEWNGLTIPLEELGRIELVRGPGSALYGANAFNGVLNITSIPPKAHPGSGVNIAAGEMDAFRGDIRHAGVFGLWSFRVNLGYLSGKSFSTIRTNRNFEYPGLNPFLNNEVKDLNLDPVNTAYGSARVDYDFEGGAVATVEGGFAQVENEAAVTGIGRVQIQKAQKPWGRLSYSGRGLNVNVWTTGRYNSKPEVSLSTGLPLTQDAEISQAEVQYNFAALDNHLFVVAGASHRIISIDTKGTLMLASRDDNMSGLFAQAEYKLTDDLKGIVAARWDRSTLHSSQFSPKAAIVWSPLSGHTFRATFNKAFQAPNYSELYLYVKHPTSALAYLGNESLSTEKVTGYEIGYKGVFSNSLFLTMDGYYNQLHDFVTSLGPGLNPKYPEPVILPGESIPRTIWSYTNAGNVNEAGYEAAANYYFSDAWVVNASFSSFSFEIVEGIKNDVLLPNSPRYRLSGGLTYTHSRGHEASISAKYVPGFPWASGVFRGDIPAYTVMNFSALYRFSDALALNLNVSNLLDRKHYEIFGGSLLGRRAIATMNMSF